MRTNTHSVISIIGIIHSLSWYILNSIISSSDNIFLILLGCPPTSALSGSQLLSVDMMIKLKNKVSHNESEVGKDLTRILSSIRASTQVAYTRIVTLHKYIKTLQYVERKGNCGRFIVLLFPTYSVYLFRHHFTLTRRFTAICPSLPYTVRSVHLLFWSFHQIQMIVQCSLPICSGLLLAFYKLRDSWLRVVSS